jgi:hypothetical protein
LFFHHEEKQTPNTYLERVIRRIVGSKTEKVTGGWVKLLTKELHNFCSAKYFFGDQIKEDERNGTLYHRLGEKEAYKILISKHQGGDHLRGTGLDEWLTIN